MRALIVVHGYPPTHSGGAERRAQRTAIHLQRRGYDVRVLAVESAESGHPTLHWEDGIQDAITVRRLFFDYHTFPDPVVWEHTNPAIAAALDTLIDEWCPDIIHLFSGYLMSSSIVTTASLRRIPVVVSLTDYWWMCHRVNLLRTDGSRCDGPTDAGCARCRAEVKRRFRMPAQVAPGATNIFWQRAAQFAPLGDRLGLPEQARRRDELLSALRRCSALIAPSQYLADFYVAHGVDRERIHVWRQGVELRQCQLRRPDTALRVGYLGQIKPHKGVDLLLDAWGMLKGNRPRRLQLYGSAAGDSAYEQRIRQQLLHLSGAEWVGQYSGNELWDILAGIDVLAVPSRWVENSPNTILEAQAVGIPVVGSRLGGVAEIISHHVNGLLFAVDDAADLAAQLQRFLDEPDLRQGLARGAIPFQTVEQEVDRICGLYEQHGGTTTPVSQELRSVSVGAG
jgi:glycosyltransferase involved in cell wall biosynthesis